MALNAPLGRKLHMGLIGGHGGFIGRVHVMAASMDQRAVLVAGALSSDPAKARAAAPEFAIAPERAYGSYQEMIDAEGRLPAGDRIDFASIATPNHTHFAIAKALVQAGFNVLCDKPLVTAAGCRSCKMKLARTQSVGVRDDVPSRRTELLRADGAGPRIDRARVRFARAEVRLHAVSHATDDH